MLDIIDAQEALSTARLNYISAEYDYARYKATVENAMGIGLNDREQAAAALMDKYAPVDALPAAAGSLQEIVEPQGAKLIRIRRGLPGRRRASSRLQPQKSVRKMWRMNWQKGTFRNENQWENQDRYRCCLDCRLCIRRLPVL